MTLSIDAHQVDDGVVRLAVAGEIDLATGEHLRAAIRTALALVDGGRLAAGKAVSYLVTNLDEVAHRVLDVTGVLPILTHP